jgi:hypothetical protein
LETVDHGTLIGAVTARGWRQGDVLPIEAHAAIGKVIGRNVESEQACIVITHSCDLVRPDPTLPIEIVIATPTHKTLDGGLTYGRSRKKLQLLLTSGNGKEAFEILALDHFKIPLTILGQHGPDQTRHWVDSDQPESLLEWLVARYARPGFPNAFENRITSDKKALVKAAKKLTHVWRIYLGLSSWGELPHDQPYIVELRFVMRLTDFEDVEKRRETLAAVSQFLKVLRACSDINVPDDPTEVLVSDDDMTLHQESQMRRWERFDYVSFKAPAHIR